ncbi:AAA family ATPase [soil metagenome]
MPQKKNSSNDSEKPQNAYFLSLELENVRCFGEKQKIDFSDGNYKPRQWTIILGDNGTGKTTLLQSMVASLPTKFSFNQILVLDKPVRVSDSVSPKFPVIDDRYPNWHLTRSGQIEFIEVEAVFSYRNNLRNENEKTDEIIKFGFQLKTEGQVSLKTDKYIKGIQNSVCFAYGASRKAGETSLSEQNEESHYITLFDETALLINPEEWLLQADYASKRLYNSTGKRTQKFAEKRAQRLESVKNTLINILPDVDQIRFTETERNFSSHRRSNNVVTIKPIVEFHTPYGWVEAKDLSLGYRTSMAWMVDFASRMFDLYPESENPLAEPAVVLIDEIDLHLHPKWQRELLDYLSNLFPNTQFIVTTHSPLIVQSAAARDANIVVCRREGDHVVIDQSLEAVRGWRADQILTSDLFDLPSTRDTEIEKLEKQRREILSKAKVTKADEKKLKMLSAELDALPVNEETEDDKAMDIIRRAAQFFQNENS